MDEAFVSVFVSVIVWLLVVPKEPSYRITGDSVSGTMVTVACWSKSVWSSTLGVPELVSAFCTRSLTALPFRNAVTCKP